ncbi:MAG: hypothetical protein ACLP1D_20915 [Xanthobacteraceae bacterium]|jgi:hypothetical protein
MKWILYIMLFSTPAATVTNKDDIDCLKMKSVADIAKIGQCRSKFEQKHVWSLQTSSHLEFSLFESCVRTQDKLIAESNVASTMTLRTWCLCEADKDGKCPPSDHLRDAAAQIRNCEAKEATAAKEAPSCQDDNASHMKSLIVPGGPNSSSIRLYPP